MIENRNRTSTPPGIRIRFALIAMPLFMASCTAIQPNRTDFLSSYEDFEQQSETDDAIVYKADWKKLARYNKIRILDVEMLLSESKTKEPISPEEITELEATFKKVLGEEFGKHFTLTSHSGSGTLDLRAAIVEVKPGEPIAYLIGHAPFVGYASAASGVLTGSNFGSGDATVQGELLDSRSHERIFAMIDRRSGSQLDLSTGFSRWGHTEKAMRIWCRKVVKGFVEAKEKTAAESKPESD